MAINKEAFESLPENEDLRVLLFARNCKACLADPAAYPTSDDFRTKLLMSEIDDDQRLAIIDKMDPETFEADEEVASLIGAVLDRNPIVAQRYAPEFVKALLPGVAPIDRQISILNKLNPVLSKAEVREVVCRLPHPFSDCVHPGKSPKIDNTEVNERFTTWMTARRIISSAKVTFGRGHIRINTFRK